MKVVKVLGGLGNQMFQYALYESLKQHFPGEEIKLDYSFFKRYKLHNGFELHSIFQLDLPQASFLERLKVTRPIPSFKLSRAIRKYLSPRKTECLEAKDYTFNQTVLTKEGSRYFDGYWQNYRYFETIESILLEKFVFRPFLNKQNANLLSEIQKANSISIHVRRGDYLKAKNYVGLCGIDFYQKAIRYVTEVIENPSFFIFSNDIAWCKENIESFCTNNSTFYVDWNTGSDSYVDMQLMSCCKHNIIANSSFSWWAAWLNNNPSKIVIAPEKWTNTVLNFTIQMPDWVLL